MIPFFADMQSDDLAWAIFVGIVFLFVAWAAAKKLNVNIGWGILAAAGIFLVCATGGWALVPVIIIYGIWQFIKWINTPMR